MLLRGLNLSWSGFVAIILLARIGVGLGMVAWSGCVLTILNLLNVMIDLVGILGVLRWEANMKCIIVLLLRGGMVRGRRYLRAF